MHASIRGLALLGLFVLGLSFATQAAADEIEVIDLRTCERSTRTVYEVTSETWQFVMYRERAKGPEQKIPTIEVASVRRGDVNDAEAETIKSARDLIRRGSYQEAAEALFTVHGGGWDTLGEEPKYKSFMAGDPTKGNQRPRWQSEYAHFFYCKALYLRGMKEKNKDILGQALMALVDMPRPDQVAEDDEFKTTGGFLTRFANGNSRWYPEAMLLHAKTLVGLGKYPEAKKVFDELQGHAIDATLGLSPRWAYEAALGGGIIEEAKGNAEDASKAYQSALTIVSQLLKNEMRKCLQLELGRYYSRARIRAAKVKLDQALEADNAATYNRLRVFIEAGMPDALKSKFAGQSKAVTDAIVSGARDPEVQAVASNGLGLAYLHEGKAVEALVHFDTVRVKNFGVRDQAALAHYYLAEAASKAAESAKKPAAKEMYEKMRDQARKALKSNYSDTEWARK